MGNMYKATLSKADELGKIKNNPNNPIEIKANQNHILFSPGGNSNLLKNNNKIKDGNAFINNLTNAP